MIMDNRNIILQFMIVTDDFQLCIIVFSWKHYFTLKTVGQPVLLAYLLSFFKRESILLIPTVYFGIQRHETLVSSSDSHADAIKTRSR
jgi:hypothetical protein